MPEIHANDFGDARLFHGDAIERLGDLHRIFVMRDYDELSFVTQLRDKSRKPVDIGIVQRCIDLVQNADGTRPITEDCNKQRQRGQCFLSAGKEQYVLQALAGRLRDDVDAAFQYIGVIQQLEIALSAPEQDLE